MRYRRRSSGLIAAEHEIERPLGYRRDGSPIWNVRGGAPDIAFLGEQHFGAADDANATTDPLVLDKDVAPFSTMSAGDVVIVFVNWRTNLAAPQISVSTTGGQTWTEQHDGNNTFNNGCYTCIFDGTWTADPAFDLAGTAVGGIGWALAYSGVDNTTPLDVTGVWTSRGAATTFTEATWDTNTDGALAIIGGGTIDNNTWSVDNGFGAPSGAGNIYWRNAAGADSSMVLTTKEIPTAGAVGATVLTQLTLGGDSGYSFHIALRPAAAPAGGEQIARAGAIGI